MKRTTSTLAFVLVLTFLTVATPPPPAAAGSANEQKVSRQIQELRDEAAALVAAQRFAEAADKYEELQVLCMNAGRYQEALDASFLIEDLSQKVSDRRSPWNYVRIAEAYLGLGDRTQYLDWMEKAVFERSFTRLAYFQDARLEVLRSEPRFARLVEAVTSEIGVGRAARDFRVTLLDGSPFALSAQVGKVVLIDFWDVRCPPCRKEMPNLKEIYADFADSGLEILGISLDTDQALPADYLRKEKPTWEITCSGSGWNDSTATLYRINATPSTWLIDRLGIVRYNDVRGEELRRAVAELIRE